MATSPPLPSLTMPLRLSSVTIMPATPFGRGPFSDFIDSKGPLLLKQKGIDVYTIGGEIVVDRVCLYEDLEKELEFVCNQKIGLPEKLTLPRAKGGFRSDRRPYREIFSDADWEKIAKLFADEIRLFGYKF